jgi:hypothetical protein
MKKLTWLIVLVLCISLISTCIVVVKTTPSTWYVAPRGSDIATGDISHPFKTIQHGVNVAQPGDTVYVRGGTYNKQVQMVRSGTAGSPITIAGYPGETAIIDGTGISLSSGRGLIHVYMFKYLTFKNLVIKNSAMHGISTEWDCGPSPPSDIIVYGCTFQNIAYSGVNFWQEYVNPNPQITNILISHCIFKNIQTSHSSGECATFVGCKDSTFEYNTMTNIHKIGVGFSTDNSNCLIDHNTIDATDTSTESAGIYVDGGQHDGAESSYLTVSNNFVYGNRQGIGFCNEIGSTTTLHHLTIVNNVVYITGGYSGIVQFNNNGLTTHYYDITIKYNTIYTTGSGSNCIGIASKDSYIHNLVIANNILVGGSGTDSELSCGFSSTNSQFKRTNNLYYSTSGILNTNFDDGTGKFEATAVKDNPEFVSLATDNFHLTSISPAIDAGSSIYTISYDYDDNPRPQGSQYDIGAYEYSTTSPPDTPIIDGPASGKVGVSYNYNFVAIDPNGDDVYYRIDWGDRSPITEWIGPYNSGQVVIVAHTFSNTGLLIIKCQAKDSSNSVSDWGQLKATMPKGKIYIPSQIVELMEKLLERFPQLSPFLRPLLGY